MNEQASCIVKEVEQLHERAASARQETVSSMQP